MNIDTNPTQWLGLLVFALATAACARAAARQPSPWRWMAAGQASCFAEVLVGLRWRVHEWADSMMQNEGWYATRQALQWPLLILVLAGLLVGAVMLTRHWRRRDAGAWVAIMATWGACVLFAVETVSLHQIDAILYAPVGPVMVVALLWTLGALAAAVAALRVAPRAA